MMRSLFSAVSGLRVHQTKMDVIANNIANVNTAGYKSSRVTFYDVFNQTLSGASRASADTGRGGTNPKQIGLGVNVASIDQIMTTGATQRTDWAFDLMIQGEGFFVLSDESGFYFSRAGAFRVDEYGNLTNAQGLAVNGWQRMLDTDPASSTYGQYIIPQGKVNPIVITADMEYANPKPTSMIDFEGNLNAALDGGKGFLTTMSFYDTVGNQYMVDVKLTYNTTDGSWDMVIQEDLDKNNAYLANDTSKKFKLDLGFKAFDSTVDLADTQSATGASYSMKVAFDANGNLIPYNFSTGTPPETTTQIMLVVEAGTAALLPEATFGRVLSDGTTNNAILMELGKLRQVNATSNATGTARDGMEPGELIAFSIGEDGVITGVYSNGTTQRLAQVAITQFKNPAGLEKVGNSLFRATSNSGEFNGIGVPPGTGGSTLLSGSLEMSNVDLSQEFTEMITTQRGFQANARVITTSDDMLQELVNLKR